MPNKCSVTGCYTNFRDGPKKSVFKFPADPVLSRKWLKFLNRVDYEISEHSVICADHFGERFIIRYEKKVKLDYSLNPIQSIHPDFMPLSLAPVPREPRKPPTTRIFQPDEIQSFQSKFDISSFSDVVNYIKQSEEYRDFQVYTSADSITSYRVVICSGIAIVKECIHIDSNLTVKLSYEGCNIPLPSYIARAEGSKLTSLDMLTNLPVYCKHAEGTCETNVIKELLKLQYNNPKGRPPYSTTVLRFALMMRYTSNSAYQYLKNFLPLPSYSLLTKLKSQSIDTSKGLVSLRENSLFSNDTVLLLDEMYVQKEVQYDGRDLTGCNSALEMYKSILCFMVVSLKKSTSYILKAVPLIKINHQIVQDGILSCISMLNKENFNIRAIVCDNHSTNVSTFKHLKERYPCSKRDNAITNPFNPDQYTYLIFDSVHLIKNIRNNLLATKFFQVPSLELTIMDVDINIPPGFIQWSTFHRVHEKDSAIGCHVKKAPKLSYQALHPGNNKQSVPLTLAIFDLTTITAISQYFPDDKTTSSFLNLIYNWWLVVNAKERFHPNIVGNALIAGVGKIEFLQAMTTWLVKWRDTMKLGLSKQTFNALISTNQAIADLSTDLLNEGYDYVLTGRLQSDPLERRFSQYLQMSGGRFLVSLKAIYRSESIVKFENISKKQY